MKRQSYLQIAEEEVAKKMFQKGYRWRVRVFSYTRQRKRHYEVVRYAHDTEEILRLVDRYKSYGHYWDHARINPDGTFGRAVKMQMRYFGGD